MDKITSFTIDHLKLKPGVYVSRVDYMEDLPITTYDIRMKAPNDEPVLHTPEMHTIEHLAATFLRNHCIYGNDIIYFGPMGCRTGFYLLMKGNLSSKKDCGNYLDMNLPMARYESNKFLEEILYTLTASNLIYPE